MSDNQNDESLDNKKQKNGAEPSSGEEKQEASQENETPTDNVSELKPDLKEELAKAKNDYLYLYAEFENYKKKVSQERGQLVKYANENVLRDLLHILDNFQLAINMDVNSENLRSFVDGVNMIKKELDNMLGRYNVQKVPSEGKTFDPNLHEAIGTEVTDEMESGKVYRVQREGYKLHDRLLRPAHVVIASDKEE